VEIDNPKLTHLPRLGCGYNKHFEYDVPLENEGVMGISIEWTNNTCKHRWGWWFDPNTKEARMSFEDRNEMLHWTIRWLAEHRSK
jgi:hypothetical protein|tara:strand:+ start:111 stop:365 length:255 start_codon:yes stop_codon:yes gene_type:complete